MPPGTSARRSLAGGDAGDGIRFVDFAIRAWREDNYVQIIAHSTPAGGMRHPAAVRVGAFDPANYRIPIDAPLAHGAEVGRALARIVFPPEVWRRFAESLAAIARHPDLGLRIRLCLDEDLIDLPWEFLYRPDVDAPAAQSGFLLTDARISLTREPPSLVARNASTVRQQRGLFLGTFFDDGSDTWRVGVEYDDLSRSMLEIKNLLDFEFVRADQSAAVERALDSGCDVFHYAGHTDIVDGRGRVVQLARADALRTIGFGSDVEGEPMPASLEAQPSPAAWVEGDVLAARLAQSGTQLAVFNACNSGLWPFVKPMMEAGIPAVIGVQGLVSNLAALSFAKKFYQALAVGLSVDEALTYARLYVIEPTNAYYPCDWGRFMAYLPSESAVVFPRPRDSRIAQQQADVRMERQSLVDALPELIGRLDGVGVGRLLSAVALRTVLILGRFTERRKPILDLIRQELAGPDSPYIPLVFDFERDGHRSMLEWVTNYAGVSRFVIADISEPKWVMAEMQKIVDTYRSVPIIPLIDAGLKEREVLAHFESFASVHRHFAYRDAAHLRALLGSDVIPAAERMSARLRPAVVA